MNPKHILFGVLNWGLGHATRSIPVIQSCLDLGHRVTLASDGFPLEFLREEFPDLEVLELPSYDVHYPGKHVVYNAISQYPRVTAAIAREHQVVHQWLNTHHCAAIISDNRYGCFADSVPSALISHIFCLPGVQPLVRSVGEWLIRKRVGKFDQVWVPDSASKSLSGDLSKLRRRAVHHIGLLSSLKAGEETDACDIACILSGPEPQRSIFESALVRALDKYSGRVILVRGAPGDSPGLDHPRIDIRQQMNRSQINALLNGSKIVICRSGYSSIMDLIALGKKAILVPTPGQPEQEYLVKKLQTRPHFRALHQDHLGQLAPAIEALQQVASPVPADREEAKIRSAISGLLGSA